jgi:hypothetical protein
MVFEKKGFGSNHLVQPVNENFHQEGFPLEVEVQMVKTPAAAFADSEPLRNDQGKR